MENTDQNKQNLPKVGKPGISKRMGYSMATIEQEKKHREQERTKIKKKMFLEYWAKSRGVISAVCEKIEISRETFRQWRENDNQFAKNLERIINQRNDDVEDMLLGKIFIDKDGASIRYYLDRKHPLYKPKMINEVIAGNRTYEDLVDDQKALIKKAQKEYDDKHKKTNEPNKQGSDRGNAKDTKQEGDSGAVPVKHSPKVLLGQENAPKPDIKSETKGNK